jgi:hypothetical protein
MKTAYKTIIAYNRGQTKGDRLICAILKREIDTALPSAESKIWHGSPVWFLDGNPIVGYHRLKDGIRLLFWSGQSFDEEGLHSEGTFKAAEARYDDQKEIKLADLRRWLAKSKKIQWDYKNIVRHKGLIRLK